MKQQQQLQLTYCGLTLTFQQSSIFNISFISLMIGYVLLYSLPMVEFTDVYLYKKWGMTKTQERYHRMVMISVKDTYIGPIILGKVSIGILLITYHEHKSTLVLSPLHASHTRRGNHRRSRNLAISFYF